METAAIRYRVADFLKQHPPFNAMADADLVALAANGRVRFFEPNQFILWQGEPNKPHVFVIQQGTVSLWDERGGEAQLRDVRGAGDLLGAEQFNGERACLWSARSTSDVVVYGFPVFEFEALLESYPYARQFVSALGTVVTDFQRGDERSDPGRLFLHEFAGPLRACPSDATVASAALILAGGGEALAVTTGDSQLLGVVDTGTLLTWMAGSNAGPQAPVAALPLEMPPTVGPDASLADGVLAMAASGTAALAMTDDGSAGGRLLSLLTPRDLAPGFGDQPASILQDVRRAPDASALKSLNRRARAVALQYLTNAGATDWIGRFTSAVDAGILTRLIELTGAAAGGCWCVCGVSGRAESIARREPRVILILDESADEARARDDYRRVVDAMAGVDYVPRGDVPVEPEMHVATAAGWRRRYTAWMQDPVTEGMAQSRSLFDLRPVTGARGLWQDVSESVAAAVDRDIIRVLAHDCLASVPPLTFYQDVVIEQSGEETPVFRLEHSALAPLVDLGRVFGMAARQVMGTSTLERFVMARRLLPQHEAIFREAAETMRIVLWQQGRAGISQGTAGTELPLSLLSRHDRHVLKSGFPAIQRLLEFSADPAWLDAI